MIETWRWYGPELDDIELKEIKQTGATGIVHALHEIPYGECWSRNAIAERRNLIESAGFNWTVVESLPVHERIKRGDGALNELFSNYRQSMANLAAEGIKCICYNFMPLLDWTRTDLAAPVENGGTCLRFEAFKMAAFDIHILKREGAEGDYLENMRSRAGIWFQSASDQERNALTKAITAGMPGAFDRLDVAELRKQLALYNDIGRESLRDNYRQFLENIIPAAEDLGIRMCVHPDDPPTDILGLPRIVCDEHDIAWSLDAVESTANGLTLCSGSLGASTRNDIPKIVRRFADRIHFAHLRNVRKDLDGSFEEAAHLEGDTDLVAVVLELLREEARRTAEGRTDCNIPMRPDHGHNLLADLKRQSLPGYPLIGRLRGLAELRGVIHGLSRIDVERIR